MDDHDDRSIVFTWTLRELLKLGRSYEWARLYVSGFAAYLAVLAIADDGPQIITVLIVVWPIAVVVGCEIRTRRRWRTVASLQEPERLSWTGEGYEMADAVNSSSASYGLVRHVLERRGLVRWFLWSGVSQAVPARAFDSEAQKDDFVARLLSAGAAEVVAREKRWARRVVAGQVVTVVLLLLAVAMLRMRETELTPSTAGPIAELDEAAERWHEEQPDEYDLEYRIAFADGQAEHCSVTVRRGIAIESTGVGDENCVNLATMEDLHDYVRGALLRDPIEVEELVFDESTGALTTFSVDLDGTPTGAWTITVLNLLPL